MVDQVKIASYFQRVADWLSRTATPCPDAAEEERPMPQATKQDLLQGLVRYADGDTSIVAAAMACAPLLDDGTVGLADVVTQIDHILGRPAPNFGRPSMDDPTPPAMQPHPR